MCLGPALHPAMLPSLSFLICEMGATQNSGVKYLKAFGFINC